MTGHNPSLRQSSRLNAALRASLATIPVPVENGQAVETCVTTDESGAWRLAFMRDGGRRKELFGEPYSMRDALEACRLLNERVWR